MLQKQRLLLAAFGCAVSLYGGTPTVIGNFTINNNSGGNYTIGQTWILNYTGGPPNVAFTICGSKNGSAAFCTPNFGSTDQNATWSRSGAF